MIETVAIAGVGLIGASFGLALKQAGFAGTVLGVSSARSIAAALEAGAIDRGVSLEEAASSADLIFLSQPVLAIAETIRHLDPLLKPGALVTDAGSTKRVICEAAKSLTRCQFVGGHPMAGKEVRGAEAADGELFRGRTWVLTGTSGTPLELEFRDWLRRIGAKELLLDAESHDHLVAWSSHLPQLLSTGLAAAIADTNAAAGKVAGPGLLDMTRLAMSSFDLWSEILETNADEAGAALDAYIEKLRALRADLPGEFAKASAFAKSLRL